jgi:aspartate kinase
MSKLVVAKFGGSAIGPDGISVPVIVERINNLKKDSKVIAVFSAPLTIFEGQKRSLTDVILEQGRRVENGENASLGIVESCYQKILELVSSENKEKCQQIIKSCLENAQNALDVARDKREFADETRSKALAFTGEILMSHVMNFILKSNGMACDTVNYENWPIITDNNIESTNFLASESRSRLDYTAKLVEENDIVTIGGFIGKTVRGGSDRTAADLGILFHKIYDTKIDFEKDSAVVSADPKIVEKDLTDVNQLSYNEARLAGMFGMKILDPIAIKEILENGVEVPIIITNMKDPSKVTTIKRVPDKKEGHPIKIVTGKKNCAIFRIETSSIQKLLIS